MNAPLGEASHERWIEEWLEEAHDCLAGPEPSDFGIRRLLDAHDDIGKQRPGQESDAFEPRRESEAAALDNGGRR